MPSIADNLAQIQQGLRPETRLVAVTKTKPTSLLTEAYEAGARLFGENKVQEMVAKYEELPKDIEWHMIGHLQTNKVKYIAPFVSLVHSVDSFKLLKEINKEAKKNDRVIDCLLQIYIAKEETKFGLSEEEALELITSAELAALTNVRIAGLMGMASNTDDLDVVRTEFRGLKNTFESFKTHENGQVTMRELSMGMSGDYLIAQEEGSTLVRVGSAIFGSR
ncbi:pyridoxal phosphate enzyme (YggS family) [Dyadobacter sp. BE34]|uniref:Pyridoxal phosphate homeostasis protein n=1 Tax=Dyadobacter fermentans TaxID=94254 RepID=A0ABU1R755_9BACT|nr:MULTISPECIES: YggS family pyridoxal phosphate-dependent enzyme [Dyadobacter]MDR6808749.1 pyridoxal phosphate enzyme (YggS family) [Dyadobacter fermentans]MDR7046492.1 pyridoxal phosphate enzyme (YggS family) [Dyadobacter sp. BE242]MDR7200805.1 pyridoxal phosphate enzyme (YggS family) [Dyadobacter sp. BE34]MDR7218765.1 pyridoxal phosphate enzyme (YggS family) [Dyadobacter sp. BE31]MDR7266695.1 pyridoxal phosphate enzyme (YggS family) [Dyadobacter sp. BE32]